MFESANCNCVAKRIAKRNFVPWCTKLFPNNDELFCILNGGLNSKRCPGAKRLEWYLRTVEEYYTSDESACKKAASKFYASKIISFSWF